MSAVETGVGAVPRKPMFSESYKTTVLWLLVLAYTFNFIDRTIISTIGQAIKVDLGLTDTQLGLLGGLAFALLYTTLGIPIAFGVIVFTIAITGLYVRRANSEYDRLTAQILEDAAR